MRLLASISLDLGLHEKCLRFESQLKCLLPAGSDTAQHRDECGHERDCAYWEFVNETLQQKASRETDEEHGHTVANCGLDHNVARSLLETVRGFQQYVLVVFDHAAALYSLAGEVSIV